MAQISETKEILERLDRLENHFKVYKTDTADLKDSVKEVRLLLGGSTLNGHKGFLLLMETIEEKVDTIEKQVDKMQKDIDNAKYWGKGITTVLFGLILVIANYIKDKL